MLRTINRCLILAQIASGSVTMTRAPCPRRDAAHRDVGRDLLSRGLRGQAESRPEAVNQQAVYDGEFLVVRSPRGTAG